MWPKPGRPCPLSSSFRPPPPTSGPPGCTAGPRRRSPPRPRATARPIWSGACGRRWDYPRAPASPWGPAAPHLRPRPRPQASAFIQAVVRTLRLEEAVAGMAHVTFHQYWMLHSPSPERDPPLVTLACVLAAIKLTCSYSVVGAAPVPSPPSGAWGRSLFTHSPSPSHAPSTDADSVCKGGHAILRRCAALNVSVSGECEELQVHLRNTSGGARSSRIPPPPTSMAQDALLARSPACPLFHARQTLVNTLGVMRLPAGARSRLGSRPSAGPGGATTADGSGTGSGAGSGGPSLVQNLLRGSGPASGARTPASTPKRRVSEGPRVPCGPGPLLEAPRFEGEVVERYRERVAPLEWEVVTANMPLIDAIPPHEACRMLALYTTGCPALVHDLAWRRLRKIMPTRVWAILTPTVRGVRGRTPRCRGSHVRPPGGGGREFGQRGPVTGADPCTVPRRAARAFGRQELCRGAPRHKAAPRSRPRSGPRAAHPRHRARRQPSRASAQGPRGLAAGTRSSS